MTRITLDGPITKPHFVLVYGGSGTGKTHLCGTLGELGNVLFVDIDTGYDTLLSAKKLSLARKSITAVSFDVFGDLDKLYKLVKANDPAKWEAAKVPCARPFDWIVYDTWSELQFFMSEKLRADAGSGKEFSGRLDFRKNIEIQHWGMLTDLNKLAVEELRKCPVNQVFTMQETLIKDELSGTVHGGPAIHGKMVQEMPAYFSIVVHTSTNAMGGFTATTKRKGHWPAKTRRGEGKDYVDPTMKEVLAG